MSTARAGVSGQVPSLLIGKAASRKEANPERAKYTRLWGDVPAYRRLSPGEQLAQLFLTQAKPAPGSHVIDFGAGTGRGSMMLAVMGHLKTTMLDFAPNCLDEDVRNATRSQPDVFKFIEHDLVDPSPVVSRYGFCCDVMEHVPEAQVPQVLRNMVKAAQFLFLGISTQPDEFGKTIGETLHVTVRPFRWWLEQLRHAEARVIWAHEADGEAFFYVSGWHDGEDVMKRGNVNTGREVLLANIAANVARGLQEVRPYQRQEAVVLLLGGGPSLGESWDEIRAKRDAGAKLVTLNGTYNEAIARGLAPSAQVVADARGFNRRFLEPAIEGCKYLLASQCDPALFDAVPAHQTWLWHAVISNDFGDELDRLYEPLGRPWFPVPGGSSVMLRAFCLLRMLGFYRFEVFGFDSCLGPSDEHHAYAQRENDGDGVMSVTCGNRVFRCNAWMLSQAQEFQHEVANLLGDVQMIVHGDGLIRHILETGAEASQLEEENVS